MPTSTPASNTDGGVQSAPSHIKKTVSATPPALVEVLTSGQAIEEGVVEKAEDLLERDFFHDRDDVGATLDLSPWPIVHGTRGSADHTSMKQPHGERTQRFYLYNSQRIHDEEEANGLYMGQLLAQNVGSGPGTQPAGQDAPSFFEEAGALIDFNIDDANAVSVITERVSDTETRLWTSTIGNIVVFRQVQNAPGLQRLATYDHGQNKRFHGSYAFVASNGTENAFFTTMEDKVARFVLKGNDQEGWTIVRVSELALPSQSPLASLAQGTHTQEKKDHLVGLTLLEDGTIVSGSKGGMIMASRLNEAGEVVYKDHLSLNDYAEGGPAWVSNSISSTGQSIFVVTHRELMCLDYDPSSKKLAFKWTALYQPNPAVADAWFVGRLGPGSGSTPSVTSCNGQELVVITDGVSPMNLLWYDARTGALVAKRKVQFGADPEGEAPTTSEQSVAVDGCKAFVVQNYMGEDRLSDDVTCISATRPGSSLRRRLGDYCLSRKDPNNPKDLFPVRACPIAFGCSAYGAALYELAGAGSSDVRRVWARDDVSCGTSIPLLSTHPESRMAYCVGFKKGSYQWSLLGMDLDTGVDRTHLQFYETNWALNALANPFYAGVEATGENTMTIGAIGGVLHLSPETPGGSVGVFSTLSSDTMGGPTDIGGGEIRLIVNKGNGERATGSMAARIQHAAVGTSIETKASIAAVAAASMLAIAFYLRKRLVASPRMPR